MPRFSVDDVDIKIDEFLRECSTREKKQLVKMLENEQHPLYGSLRESIDKFLNDWKHLLTTEEEETIRKITERF
jgi:hypothetical protein